MKYFFIFFLFISSSIYGQLSREAKEAAHRYKLGSYSYHEQFLDHYGYGAPMILTKDGGTAVFGDYGDESGSYGLLVKLDKAGVEEWKKIVRPEFDELESQSVVQDKNGNYYVFMISYDHNRYRGGSQRIVCFDTKGEILWDKTIGKYDVMDNPTISYIRMLDDGSISLRGHVVTEQPEEGSDPKYHFWEGWINAKGELTQKAGDILDWSNPDWEKRYRPE